MSPTRKRAPARPSPVSPARRAAILNHLGREKTAIQVAKEHKVSINQVRGWAHEEGLSTLRGTRKEPLAAKKSARPAGPGKKAKGGPKAKAKAKAGKKAAARRRAATPGTLVATPLLRPVFNRGCESCSLLLSIIRDLVGRLRPRALLGAKT